MSSPDTTMKIYGAGHLVGQTVQMVICGVYAGTAVVAADGSATFTFGSDPAGILTVAYLVANPSEGTDHDVTFQVWDGAALQTVTVSLLVGLAYTVQGQLVRPTAEAQLAAGPGAGLGKTRRAVWGSFLVRDLLALQVGTNLNGTMFDLLVTSDGMGTPELAIAADSPYSGVHVCTLEDALGFDSALAWQTNKPVPVIIGAASTFLEGSTR